MGFIPTSLFYVYLFLLSQILNSSNSLSPNNNTLSQEPRCRPNESSALFQFKFSFSFDNSYFACNYYSIQWNESSDCCSWTGVTCDEVSGHVIGLDLNCSGLSGNISPNSTLFLLSHLKTLDLSNNDFRGSSISPEFGTFSNMISLNLTDSNFRGLVPFEISLLSKLVSLRIGQYSENMTSIGIETFKAISRNLTKLRELVLGGVDLSSAPMMILTNVSSSLTFLDLVGCNLIGELPERIFRLPNLQMLSLSSNEELSGSFPVSNWSTSLKKLDLSYTRISIDLPYLLNNARSLSSLVLSNCHFVGSYPLLRSNFSQISVLILSNNKLSGKIPWSSLNIKGLYTLDLSFNNFEGQLLETYRSNSTHNFSSYAFPRLTYLRLSNNFLDGPIPSWIYALPSLTMLDIRNNAFTGESLANRYLISFI